MLALYLMLRSTCLSFLFELYSIHPGGRCVPGKSDGIFRRKPSTGLDV